MLVRIGRKRGCNLYQYVLPSCESLCVSEGIDIKERDPITRQNTQGETCPNYKTVELELFEASVFSSKLHRRVPVNAYADVWGRISRFRHYGEKASKANARMVDTAFWELRLHMGDGISTEGRDPLSHCHNITRTRRGEKANDGK